MRAHPPFASETPGRGSDALVAVDLNALNFRYRIEGDNPRVAAAPSRTLVQMLH